MTERVTVVTNESEALNIEVHHDRDRADTSRELGSQAVEQFRIPVMPEATDDGRLQLIDLADGEVVYEAAPEAQEDKVA